MIFRFPRTHAHDLPCERCAFIRSLHSPRSPHGTHGPHAVYTGDCTGISKNLEGVGGAKGKDEMDEGDEDADVKLRMRNAGAAQPVDSLTQAMGVEGAGKGARHGCMSVSVSWVQVIGTCRGYSASDVGKSEATQ